LLGFDASSAVGVAALFAASFGSDDSTVCLFNRLEGTDQPGTANMVIVELATLLRWELEWHEWHEWHLKIIFSCSLAPLCGIAR